MAPFQKTTWNGSPDHSEVGSVLAPQAVVPRAELLAELELTNRATMDCSIGQSVVALLVVLLNSVAM